MAFANEVEAGSCEESASDKDPKPVLIQSELIRL
jgi:hypothetical protein